MNQVNVVEGFCVSIERGDSVVSFPGSNPLVAVSGRDKQPGQRGDAFEQIGEFHVSPFVEGFGLLRSCRVIIFTRSLFPGLRRSRANCSTSSESARRWRA